MLAGIIPTMVIFDPGRRGRRGEREREESEERGSRVESSPNLVGCLCVILFDAFFWAGFPVDESRRGEWNPCIENLCTEYRVLRGTGIDIFHTSYII